MTNSVLSQLRTSPMTLFSCRPQRPLCSSLCQTKRKTFDKDFSTIYVNIFNLVSIRRKLKLCLFVCETAWIPTRCWLLSSPSLKVNNIDNNSPHQSANLFLPFSCCLFMELWNENYWSDNINARISSINGHVQPWMRIRKLYEMNFVERRKITMTSAEVCLKSH